MNEFENTLNVYVNVVDKLLNMKGNICSWSKDNSYANFLVPAFKTMVTQHGRGENYRYYMRHFRIMSWIICQEEKFSNVQRIEGKPVRVITVDYKLYAKLKLMVGNNTYNNYLNTFVKSVDLIIDVSKTNKKDICMFSCNGTIANIKSSDFRMLLRKCSETMSEYKECIEIFRNMAWIISQPGNYTNVQWIKGKSIRVISVDYVKYKMIKQLMGEKI
ncbi:MAG: hypothetical protein ACK5MV_14345 [Aminipila sp.]